MTAHANWIAVASAEHVSLGRTQGFMQVCHGKSAPLRRVTPDSRVVYYSPTGHFGGKDKLQSFTAIGVVTASEPYQFDMGGGFQPFRRDVTWLKGAARADPAAAWTSWNSPPASATGARSFATVLFSISDHDMTVIADAMGACFPEH